MIANGDSKTGTAKAWKAQYLTFNGETANLGLARRLPREVACRYHVLPVAEDGERVTVAMANPQDQLAQAAVGTALGTTPYIVKGDVTAIDAMLEEVWQEERTSPLRFLIYIEDHCISSKLSAYAAAVSELLSAKMSTYPHPGFSQRDLETLAQETESKRYDLIITQQLDQSIIQRLAHGPLVHRLSTQIPASLLFCNNQRWPIRKILLVVGDHHTGIQAEDWTVTFARCSGASVTVLAIVPPVPAMYGQQERMQQGLTALLNTRTTLGQKMHRAAQRLVDWEIDGRLRLCEGPFDRQLQQEVLEGDHDLIIVDADPVYRHLQCLANGLVSALLRWTDRPVLIAKPS